MHRRPVVAPWPQVQLWSIDLDQPWPGSEAEGLSAAERARAARFLRPVDAHRYRIGRRALREQLAAVLGCAPLAVPLTVTAQGKPVLDVSGGLPWHFNLSHSGDVGLLGLTPLGPIGVDIECPRPMDDLEALVRVHFTAEERDAWRSVPAPQRLAIFLRVWTRKEACLKAWGTGLSLPTAEVEVGAEAGERVVSCPDPVLAGVWRVCSLAVPDNAGCEAAVALGTAGGRHA